MSYLHGNRDKSYKSETLGGHIQEQLRITGHGCFKPCDTFTWSRLSCMIQVIQDTVVRKCEAFGGRFQHTFESQPRLLPGAELLGRFEVVSHMSHARCLTSVCTGQVKVRREPRQRHAEDSRTCLADVLLQSKDNTGGDHGRTQLRHI